MKTETNVKAEIVSVNHAETSLGSLKLRTHLKAGVLRKPGANHNEAVAQRLS